MRPGQGAEGVDQGRPLSQGCQNSGNWRTAQLFSMGIWPDIPAASSIGPVRGHHRLQCHTLPTRKVYPWPLFAICKSKIL